MKKVHISESGLMKLRESVGSNAAHETSFVKSPSELDTFYISPEGGANDNFHITNEEVEEENLESEVEASEVKLDSFKTNSSLAPKVWIRGRLNPRVRLKLLDIADDFWEFANIGWTDRESIRLTGSICNYNWSKYSDIDLHIVVDFSKIDERTDFVQEYFDSKKNDWNSSHDKLKIYGYTVELYVEDVNATTTSGGIYDLEENKWIRKPSRDDIKDIELNKYDIKSTAAKLMTSIDEIVDETNMTNDEHELYEAGQRAHKLLNKIKRMRKFGLERGGESDTFNIVYKVLRRTGYLDKLWSASNELYDKVNSIGSLSENVRGYIDLLRISLNEEVVADGSAEHNPYSKRWKEERDALKQFISNFGVVMQSRENGKLYKCYFDKYVSSMIGYNYCLCVQWDNVSLKPKSIVYIRALDKFTQNIRQVQFDTRGNDNMSGTLDDIRQISDAQYY